MQDDKNNIPKNNHSTTNNGEWTHAEFKKYADRLTQELCDALNQIDPQDYNESFHDDTFVLGENNDDIPNPPQRETHRPSNEPQLFRRSYILNAWQSWDHELHAFVHDFKNEFGCFPNILLAHPYTYAKIDLVAEKTKFFDADGNPLADNHYGRLDSFIGDEYQLEFCEDGHLAEKCLTLIYDSDPGGRDDIAVEDSEPIRERRKYV